MKRKRPRIGSRVCMNSEVASRARLCADAFGFATDQSGEPVISILLENGTTTLPRRCYELNPTMK
ncbi:hypothetical protein PspLS_08304 [Pyricularia sp. CBS 133598]|nr:hypothetical protein PspLS_08304 [Pyricularia sp. CBS 133598]